MQNEKYIRRCLQLARLGEYYVAPNPMVGAVLVRCRNGVEEVLSEGWHEAFGGPHAEVNCLRRAEEKGICSFEDCTLYVSLEPCSHYGKTPPCAKLLVEKRIPRVVVGCLDPNEKVSGRGVAMLREAGIKVVTGVLQDECRALNRRFICLHEKHRPYVILKWAQTADGFLDYGRTAGKAADGPLVISNAVTKQLVHKMRAENMAIMVGTRTALLDNPRLLTTRWSGRNPVRVLPDRHRVVPRDSRIFSDDSQTVVYSDCTDWQYILDDLGRRGIHSLLVEGGRIWLDTVIESGVWDEMHIEVSPVRIGAGVAAPKVPLGGAMPVCVHGHLLYTVTNNVPL